MIAGDESSLHAVLMSTSREAHARSQHEVAFHSLAAAMHAANDARDERALREIGREASRQVAWIDEHEPAHRLSTASASEHRHPGVFPTLVRQANVLAAMLQMPHHHSERNARGPRGGGAPDMHPDEP